MQKIAVAGVNGTLGKGILKHLLEAGFTVTAVTTNSDKITETWGEQITTVKADYSSLDTLCPCFHGQDAVVSLINRQQETIQKMIIDAAGAANCYLIPSCFGVDTQDNPQIRSNPALQEKIHVDDYLLQRASEGKIAFTGIHTSMFFEWIWTVGLPVNAKGITPIFDGGNTRFTMSSLDDIGRAVANVLKMKDKEPVRNKFLLMQTMATTQNELLEMAKEAHPGLEWKTVDVDTEQTTKRAQELYDQGHRDPESLRGFFPRPTFGLGLGWFERNDNAILGIREWDKKQIKAGVKGCIDSVLA